MAYQQKFSRLTDKSHVVQKGAMAGICPCGTAFRHRFSWRIIIPVSSATRGRIWAGVYLPLSKIILIHNPFQMSYWLGEASLPFSIRGFYLQYTYKALVSQHLSPRQWEKDRDIWKTLMKIEIFQVMEHPLWQPFWRSIGFCFERSCCAGICRDV